MSYLKAPLLIGGVLFYFYPFMLYCSIFPPSYIYMCVCVDECICQIIYNLKNRCGVQGYYIIITKQIIH